MHGLVIEETRTLIGSGAQTLTQGANAWLDLLAYRDVVAWWTTHEFNANGGTLQVGYQTSTLQEDASFVTIVGPTITNPFTPSTGTQQITPMLTDLMTVPLARWFRWQILATGSFGGPWDITFTLRLAANCLSSKQLKRGPDTRYAHRHTVRRQAL